MHVLGRRDSGGRDDGGGDGGAGDRPAVRLGHYRASDGSAAAPVGLDADRPHAVCVVGKRGSGKSNTLAALAEGLADVSGARPLVCDRMGAFEGLAEAGFDVVEPRVPAASLPPRAWPELLGLDSSGGPGSLVWQAAADRESLAGMSRFAETSDAAEATRRAAANHLRLAGSWDVFGGTESAFEGPTVVSLSGLADRPAGAVVRALTARCYRRRVEDEGPLPWLFVDEAHVHFDGVARPALERLLTRGRGPGVSLVCATQRPDALPETARSQSDVVVAHRLTAAADRDALCRDRPGVGERESLDGRWPNAPGEAVVLNDATGRAHTVQVKERETPHGGASPRASEVGGTGERDPTRSPPR